MSSMIPAIKTQHNSNVAENKITIKDMQQNNNHHDMNLSNHSRQETCNNPYNSRTRIPQVIQDKKLATIHTIPGEQSKFPFVCVIRITATTYMICPPTQSCHMGSIVISGGIIQVQCSFHSLLFGN
jgi:hypothetical protein